MYTLSVSSYSFSQAVKDGRLTPFACIAKAKEIGFDAIEFTELEGKTHEEQMQNAKKYREEATRVGISIRSYVVGANLCRPSAKENRAEVKRLCEQVDVCEALGARVFRHDVCYAVEKSGKFRSFDMMLPTVAKNARAVTKYAEKKGIRTCTENHGYLAQDSDRVERLFNAVNHRNYGLLVDIGNFVCADENPLTAVSRVAPYAVHVHAKDMVVGERAEGSGCFTRAGIPFQGAVLGEGDVPVAKCLNALKRAGYTEGIVTLEYEAPGDCLEGIAKGLAFLKAALG